MGTGGPLIAIGRGDEVELFVPKASVSCVVWFGCAWKDFTSGRRTGNSVMEILSMYQERRGQFPKEITKTREATGRPFCLLSHLLRSFRSQGRSKLYHSSMQLCTREVQGLRRAWRQGHWAPPLAQLYGDAWEATLIAVVETPRGSPVPPACSHTWTFDLRSWSPNINPSRYCPQTRSCLYQTEGSVLFLFSLPGTA